MTSHKIIIHYELVSSVAIIHLKATSTQLPITEAARNDRGAAFSYEQ